MAYCPKCNGEMTASAVECPHCHYDFADAANTPANDNTGFAYSAFADIALIISTIAASMGCIVTAYWTIVMLFSGNLYTGLIMGPLAFFIQLGLVVVFLRVQK